jgi:hypothetical protein
MCRRCSLDASAYFLARCGVAIALLVWPFSPALADDRSAGCDSRPASRFMLGYGTTFRFHHEEDRGNLYSFAFKWRCDRYELAALHFGEQTDSADGEREVLAPRDYAVSVSRRWHFQPRSSFQLLFGFGASYRTRAGPSDGNTLNGSHLNFAEQLGVHWMPHDQSPGFEISFRHFSNLGIVRPNPGQNFLMFSVVY